MEKEVVAMLEKIAKSLDSIDNTLKSMEGNGIDVSIGDRVFISTDKDDYVMVSTE